MKKKIIKRQKIKIVKAEDILFDNIALLIEQSKQRVAIAVNAELTVLYWNIGKLIQKSILENKRAGYGEQIVQTVSEQLMQYYGKGFSKVNLTYFVRFYSTYRNFKIVQTLSEQFSWSHFVTLVAIKNDLQRTFYEEICRMERWSVRRLRERIDSMLFERTAISKKPAKLIKQELAQLRSEDKLTTDLVFRDPYFLDFLGLKDTFSEKDLETTLIAELQRFIIELGTDFAFLARQKRITVDHEDNYLDLLFYHRKLRRLVAIDLKIGKFRPVHKAQMELYLNWLNKYERADKEEPPIGLILCADKSDEYVELMMLNKGNIRVAQYLTGLPSKKLLQRKLHAAWELAQERFPEESKVNKLR